MLTTSNILGPDEFLAACEPRIQVVAQQLRQLVHKTIPKHHEAVYIGWHLIGYRLGDSGKGRYFCFIAPMPNHVRLGFEYGVFMHDEHQVLEGNGKQVRYVALYPDQQFQAQILVPLIHEAALVADLRG